MVQERNGAGKEYLILNVCSSKDQVLLVFEAPGMEPPVGVVVF